MAVQDKAIIKEFFNKGDRPTEAQFVDLIDSYLDHDDTVHAIASAVQGGKIGVIEALATANVTLRQYGSAGLQVVLADETISARSAIGGGTFGSLLFTTETTASGRALLAISDTSVVSTADTDIFGIVQIATTAEALAGALGDRVPSTETLQAVRGWTLLETQSASSSATIDFITGIDSTYNAYVIVVSGAVPATDDVEFWIRISDDAGSTWKEGATDYEYVGTGKTTSAADVNVSSAGDTEIKMTATDPTLAVGNAAGEHISGVFTIHNPSSSSLASAITYELAYLNSTGGIAKMTGMGIYNGATTAIDGIRFLFESGNIASGEFSLYGIKK